MEVYNNILIRLYHIAYWRPYGRPYERKSLESGQESVERRRQSGDTQLLLLVLAQRSMFRDLVQLYHYSLSSLSLLMSIVMGL